MQDALNAQINAEYYSSYLYLSMAAHAESLSLKGFAHWFRIQVQEEMMHAMKFFDYVVNRRGVVKLATIECPPTTWDSPAAMFEATLKHEQMVTDRINKLADLAIAEHDHATHTLLEWFISEQVEEESVADNIVEQFKLTKGSADSLYLIDRELGTRTLSTATPAE
jgi:ferritin